MPQSDPQLTVYYAARAAEYERIYDKPERQDDLQRLRALIPAYFAGRSVLEIACGTGYWTQFIAPPASSVTALDINEETLAIAREKPLSPDRVCFETADVHALHPRYQGYGGAFAGFWWCCWITAMSKAAARRLRTPTPKATPINSVRWPTVLSMSC